MAKSFSYVAKTFSYITKTYIYVTKTYSHRIMVTLGDFQHYMCKIYRKK